MSNKQDKQRRPQHGVKQPQIFELGWKGKEGWNCTLTRNNDLPWQEAAEVVAVDSDKQPIIKKLVNDKGKAIGFVVNVEHLDVIAKAINWFYDPTIKEGESPITVSVQ